jgi:site-specific recombinase XerD
MHESILRITNQKLKYFRYSENTISTYCHYIEKFLIFTRKYSQHLTGKDFQLFLENYKFSSGSQQNQIINALKFFYEKVLNRKYGKIKFERPRKERKLPDVIPESIIRSKINSITNLKHQAIIALAYSDALRVSDIVNFKIKDINSDSMQIKVIQGKGNKDAYLPLSENILFLLRKYFKAYQPKEYIFNGQSKAQYSANSCNKIVKRYFGERYTFHTLRHSCLTHLMDKGVNQRLIQKLARHASSKTTEIYTHVSKTSLEKLPIF